MEDRDGSAYSVRLEIMLIMKFEIAMHSKCKHPPARIDQYISATDR